jgi:hypothetical protein
LTLLPVGCDKWWIIRQPQPAVFAFGTKPIGDALLAKIDILSVFRLMILHPDDFELLLLIVLETIIWGLVYCLKNTGHFFHQHYQ